MKKLGSFLPTTGLTANTTFGMRSTLSFPGAIQSIKGLLRNLSLILRLLTLLMIEHLPVWVRAPTVLVTLFKRF